MKKAFQHVGIYGFGRVEYEDFGAQQWQFSLKFVLFKMSGEQVLISGTIDRIGISQSTVSFQESDKQPEVILGNIPDHGAALDTLFQVLTTGPVSDLMDIPSIAHRVAHGGKFRESVVITPEARTRFGQ